MRNGQTGGFVMRIMLLAASLGLLTCGGLAAQSAIAISRSGDGDTNSTTQAAGPIRADVLLTSAAARRSGPRSQLSRREF